MECRNRYCYYELDGKCSFGETIIDKNGRCAICNNIKPTEERLKEIKDKTREERIKNLEYALQTLYHNNSN